MKTGRALIVSSLLLGSLTFAANSGPVPFDVEVEFDFAAASGDVGFQEDAELQLISELRRAACFRSVKMADHEGELESPDDVLRLLITVIEVFEETIYDVSTAQRVDPRSGPGMELAHTARIDARIQATLEHPASGLVLRTRRIRASSAHRPLSHYDDARDYVRREALLEVIRETRVFVCKGGSKRLGKELAR